MGWRESTVEPAEVGGAWGYLFATRTVYDEGDSAELDVKATEFVDESLAPRRASFSESGAGPATSLEALVNRGFVKLNAVDAEGSRSSEVLFQSGTEFTMPLMRRLADMAHFPEKGESYRIFDASEKRFARMNALRTLRKEVVGGKHQFVTVWKLTSGEQVREVWVDGWGGIVREEIGGPAMVAMRAAKDKVLAYSRGEGNRSCDLSLSYENAPSAFRIERPNLTWSFDLPDEDGALALTILNPVLQASVDVMTFDTKDKDCEPETILIDVMRRMEKGAEGVNVLYQKPEKVGAKNGVEFQLSCERKGTTVKTLGAVTVSAAGPMRCFARRRSGVSTRRSRTSGRS